MERLSSVFYSEAFALKISTLWFGKRYGISLFSKETVTKKFKMFWTVTARALHFLRSCIPCRQTFTRKLLNQVPRCSVHFLSRSQTFLILQQTNIKNQWQIFCLVYTQPASKEPKAALRAFASSVFEACTCLSWSTWSLSSDVLKRLNPACKDDLRALATALCASRMCPSWTAPVASEKKANLEISKEGSLPLMCPRNSESKALSDSGYGQQSMWRDFDSNNAWVLSETLAEKCSFRIQNHSDGKYHTVCVQRHREVYQKQLYNMYLIGQCIIRLLYLACIVLSSDSWNIDRLWNTYCSTTTPHKDIYIIKIASHHMTPNFYIHTKLGVEKTNPWHYDFAQRIKCNMASAWPVP